MNRHFWRACDRGAGFSFVELLVTIIIAGIAFAAIVPMFVMAQDKNVDDNMRTISTQLAQDKIEKIRQLPYEQIAADAAATPLDNPSSTAAPNLYNKYFASGQFGSTWDAHSAGSTVKVMKIDYSVQLMPATQPGGAATQPGQETYKLVTVAVTWTGPPDPQYTTTLRTVVYKQYAGPQIISYEFAQGLQEVSNDVYELTSSPVILDAYINPADIEGMDATNADVAKRGWVRFTVSNLNGSKVAGDDVNAQYNSEAGHYRWTWDSSSAPENIYVFTMTAFSKNGFQGNTLSVAYRVVQVVPPAITDLAATPQQGANQLGWSPTTVSDFSHYELWRKDGAAGTYARVGGDLSNPSYADTAVDPTHAYYYYVKVVDADGNISSASNVAGPVSPIDPSGTPPSIPAGLSVTQVAGSNALNISWTASTPMTGRTIKGYDVQRSSDNGLTWQQILSSVSFAQLSYQDTGLLWSHRYDYRVQAVDSAGRASTFSPSAFNSTVAQLPFDLAISNGTSGKIYVWVQSATTNNWLTKAGGNGQTNKPSGEELKTGNGNDSATWKSLPGDGYNVFYSTSSSGSNALTQYINLSKNDSLVLK
jgi:type II secretory pathway pseudopilin PulG